MFELNNLNRIKVFFITSNSIVVNMSVVILSQLHFIGINLLGEEAAFLNKCSHIRMKAENQYMIWLNGV